MWLKALFLLSLRVYHVWGGDRLTRTMTQSNCHLRPMGLLPDTYNCGLRMCREYRERFPRHRLERKPLASDPSMHDATFPAHAQPTILRIWQEVHNNAKICTNVESNHVSKMALDNFIHCKVFNHRLWFTNIYARWAGEQFYPSM